MIRPSLLLIPLLATGMASAGVVHAGLQMAFDSEPVSDGELAGTYGKFLAPGGIDIAMAVQSDTAVNGQLVLRSVFTVDQGPATVQVFAPAAGTTGPSVQAASDAGQAPSGQQNQGLAVTFDRTGANMSVSPAYGGTWAPNFAVVTGGARAAAATGTEGLVPVDVAPGGGSVETGAGQVSAAFTNYGSRVVLEGAGLSISHLMGSGVGSVVANSVNDRTIDTVTTISIGVRNAEALTMESSMLQVDGIATAATQAMMR